MRCSCWRSFPSHTTIGHYCYQVKSWQSPAVRSNPATHSLDYLIRGVHGEAHVGVLAKVASDLEGRDCQSRMTAANGPMGESGGCSCK